MLLVGHNLLADGSGICHDSSAGESLGVVLHEGAEASRGTAISGAVSGRDASGALRERVELLLGGEVYAAERFDEHEAYLCFLGEGIGGLPCAGLHMKSWAVI